MSGFAWNDAAGSLTIGDVDMTGPAWQVMNLHELWLPAAQRGNDVILAGTDGCLPRDRRRDSTTRTLRIKVSGTVDPDGQPNSNAFEGLQENVDALAAVASPGLQEAVLGMPDGTERTADVHVSNLQFGEVNQAGKWVLATIDVTIPAGEFVEDDD